MLVTGGSGFLGQHLAIASEADSWELLAPPSTVLDIRRRERAIEEITSWKPYAVVHLAYRRDDRRAIVDGSRNVAEAAARCGARLVHLSSDAVFPGRPQPYTEADEPFPITEYGRLKLEAEAAVTATCPGAVLLRTSLLYGTDRLATIQHDVERAINGRAPMTFFTDEYRCPAHAADVATAVSTLAARVDISGPLHVAGPDAVSRAELAANFARWMGFNPALLRTATLEGSGVIRPARVVLDSSIASRHGLRCRSLGDALR
jgi:dTDP-4-dehydrorhamnose reductase